MRPLRREQPAGAIGVDAGPVPPLQDRPAPAARGRHSRTPESWRKLTEDLDGAAASMAALDQELAGVRAELAAARAELEAERWVRGLQDDLIGRLVRVRNHWEGHAHEAYRQLSDTNRSLRRSGDVIDDLRQRLHGGAPAEAGFADGGVMPEPVPSP